nr:UDP-glycosyltransferase superfamily protein [Tanacetum cinerariifolium]
MEEQPAHKLDQDGDNLTSSNEVEKEVITDHIDEKKVTVEDEKEVTVKDEKEVTQVHVSSNTQVGSDGKSKPALRKLQSELSSFILGSSDKRQSSVNDPFRLEKSKTERPKRSNMLAEQSQQTPQFLNETLSANQKLQMLNKIATVRENGTVEFEIPGHAELCALGAESGKVYNACDEDNTECLEPRYLRPLQVVILIVGTRGDVQPFVAIAKRLQDYGHRVRLATHSNFKEFVLTAGLEFYPLGGDPKVLAE